ncbi:MAG: fructose-bisphosphatase class II, partial [Oceanicaulis sp.]
VPEGRKEGVAGGDVSDEDYQAWVDAFEAAYATEEFAAVQAERGLLPLNLAGEELQASIETRVQNVREIAKARGVDPSEVTVCVRDRDRHAEIIDSVRSSGARIMMISDGDVAGVIAAADPDGMADLYVGRGGAPEGVLGAAALRCLGGQMQGRLHFRTDDERERAKRTGITDLDRKYDLTEMASKDCLFVAAGVTEGDLVHGVRHGAGYVETQTLLFSSVTGLRRRISTRRPLKG